MDRVRTGLLFAFVWGAPFLATPHWWIPLFTALGGFAVGLSTGTLPRAGFALGWMSALTGAAIVSAIVIVEARPPAKELFSEELMLVTAVGGVIGLLAALPFCCLVISASAIHARARSMVGAAATHRVWAFAALMVAIGTPILAAIGPGLAGRSTTLACCATAVGLACLADITSIVEIARLAERIRGLPARPMRTVVEDQRVRDLGVGGCQYELRAPGAVYREGERVVMVVRGDPSRARRILVGQLACDCVALAICTALFFLVHDVQPWLRSDF